MEYAKNRDKNYSWAIDFVKCLAVLLVLNNHMKEIYPMSSLAFGGALGNALFFVVSGYMWSNLNNKGFFTWYSRKIERIWIPTVITNIVYLILFVAVSELNAVFLFKIFLYPNKSWFCGAILLYAAIYYFVIKYKKQNSILYAVVVSVVIYGIWYCCKLDRSYFSLEGMSTGGLCRVVHYFLCMLMGLLYKEHENVFPDKVKKNFLPIGVLTFVLSYAGKFLIGKNVALLNFQFLIQFLNLLSAVCILASAIYHEKKVSNNRVIRGKEIVRTIARYSWELYLVQTLVLPLCASLSFPINMIVSLIIIAVFSFLLKIFTNYIYITIDKVFRGGQR